MKSEKRRVPLYSVYTLSSSENPEVVKYIGISKNPADRIRYHKRRNGREGRAKSEWVRGVVEAGFDLVMRVTHSGLSHEDACETEVALIAEYKKNGFNLVNGNSGGAKGFVPDDSVRERLSLLATGRRHSPETIEKMRIACRHETTDETRLKLSAASKGRKMSDEAREKISKALKGRKPHKNTIDANRERRGEKKSPEAVESQRRGMMMSGKPKAKGKKFRGVFVSGENWSAGIKTKELTVSISRLTEELAAKSRDRLMLCLYGFGNCHLNFPECANDYADDPKDISMLVSKMKGEHMEDKRRLGLRTSGGRKTTILA